MIDVTNTSNGIKTWRANSLFDTCQDYNIKAFDSATVGGKEQGGGKVWAIELSACLLVEKSHVTEVLAWSNPVIINVVAASAVHHFCALLTCA